MKYGLNLIQLKRSQVASPLQWFRERLRAYDVYLSALLIFAVSRVIVVIGVNFGTLLDRAQTPGQWDAGGAWYYRLLRWDAGFYADIASNGYQYSDDASHFSSTVFYPLYPLVSYAVKELFGVNQFVALLLVANAAALVGTMLMTKVVKDEGGAEVALLSVAFFCFFPSSLFLSSGYAESLFLTFVLLSFIFLARKEFVIAAILAGLSLGTRPNGIVMIPVILMEMARRNVLPWPRMLPRMVLCGLLAAAGLLAYIAYLDIEFGRPWAFITGQAAWHNGTFSDRFVSAATLVSLFTAEPVSAGVLFLVFLALTIGSIRDSRWAQLLYGLGTLALPYYTLGIDHSMERYVLVCFPAFTYAGVLCKGRPRLAITFIGISGALLLLNTARFSQWYWSG